MDNYLQMTVGCFPPSPVFPVSTHFQVPGNILRAKACHKGFPNFISAAPLSGQATFFWTNFCFYFSPISVGQPEWSSSYTSVRYSLTLSFPTDSSTQDKFPNANFKMWFFAVCPVLNLGVFFHLYSVVPDTVLFIRLFEARNLLRNKGRQGKAWKERKTEVLIT